nr:hypothetical protein [Roseobacter sp. GAI101]
MAIARALLWNTKSVLDEAVASLDVSIQRRC